MYIPHTEKQKNEMLNTIGVKNFDELLKNLPSALLRPKMDLPPSMTEMELVRHVEDLAQKDHLAHSFLGAGAYEHFIPTAVWSLALRGEFLTAYTPYQAEASQGTLQAMYEFQTMVCELLGMDISNASLYDGASAAAEACLLATKHTGRPEILIPETVHPQTRQVIQTYLSHSGAKIVTLQCPLGVLAPSILQKTVSSNTAAVLLQNPNFFGSLENVHEISETTHKAGALLIASSYPVALGLVTPPGEYSADIAVAEGQPLGIPLGYGGPYVGFFACKSALMRKMPGRVAGQTTDAKGKRAFVLTLQAREQHIRREKATSNICTNQALYALATAIHMALLGRGGLKHLANLNFQKAHYTQRELEKRGFTRTHSHPFFNEFAVKCPISPEKLVDKMAESRILAGLPLGQYFPGLKEHLLICTTEIKTKDDIDSFCELMESACR